jgi:hypothetical protein
MLRVKDGGTRIKIAKTKIRSEGRTAGHNRNDAYAWHERRTNVADGIRAVHLPESTMSQLVGHIDK